ncbi:MAG: GH3 auxin-responsive promoter family protein [Phycisphaerae bacterium]|nr:GH3 auxin-responsive promoter family protein [Phycisphaerae bacterium]
MAGLSLLDKLMLPIARVHARGVFRRVVRDTRDIVNVQNRVLLDKVRANSDSAYGRDFGFQHIRSYADFVRQVPVTIYEDLAPYVARVRQGELSAMFGSRQRVLMFAMSSGSTAEPKYVPVTEKFLKNYRRGWNAFGVRAVSDHPGTFLRHIVQVSSPMDEQNAPSGIPCGAITGIMAATQKRLVRKYYVAPFCVAYIADASARYYTIMRLALAKDVAFMITANPATQLKLARTVDSAADRIIRDIHDGTLDPALPITNEIRDQLKPRLKPDPAVARRLEHIHNRTGRLLPKDYWNLGFLANWTGGTMGLYLRQFSEYFGDTPVRDIGLLASEGRMSIPITDGTPAGVLDVGANFFEFIPIEEIDRPNPTVLRAHQVQVGSEYEILLTTDAGFYRYRIGDVVQVVGFLGPTPLIEFLHKGANTSSLTGEKLTERQVVLAFEQARQATGCETVTFLLAPHWADPPYYVLHIDSHCPTELAEHMDRSLRRVNIEYDSKRETQRLGPVRANQLPEGYLTRLQVELSARYRASNEQYKAQYLYCKPGDDAELPVVGKRSTSAC